MTIQSDGTEKVINVNNRSQVTTIKPDEAILKVKKLLPITKTYRGVNKNEVKLAGKASVEAESRGIRKNLTMLIAEREDIKPLHGIDWPPELK